MSALNTNPTPVPVDSDQLLEQKLRNAAEAFKSFRETRISDRSVLLMRAADILEREVERYAALITREMGKTIVSARAEILKCALACRYYAENAVTMLSDEPAPSGYMRSFVRFQPLGTVLAIMPWNFPFWQVFRFAAPALMAGNTALLKHAPNVPQCSLAIKEVFERAGFEKGVFQSIFAEPETIAALIEDDRIAAVTLTGSEVAGSAVASAAGRAIKKVVLELGGSDPFVVMPSADIPLALATAVRSRMVNNGQSCIAAKRILLHESIYPASLEKLVEAVKSLRVGDPLDENTEIGPLALERFAIHLEDQVERAVAAGATVLVGGKRHSSFFEPTVLIGLPQNCAVASEELFGPVMVVDTFATIKDAVAIANSTPFGLAASIWTKVETEQSYFIEHLEVGQVFVNAMTASDPRIPFGGTKKSGLGRELGVYGIREFTNIKSVSFG